MLSHFLLFDILYNIPLRMFFGTLFVTLFEASEKGEENNAEGAQQVAPPHLAVQKDYVEEEAKYDLEVIENSYSTCLFY